MSSFKPFIQREWEAAGFDQQTAIQSSTLEPIQLGQDVMAESPTGTGKTLAYLLPILNQMDASASHVQAIILAPSRELVMQIFDVAQKWATAGGIRVGSFIGGAALQRQLDKLKKKPQLIVGTPGRIEELIQMRKLKMHTVKTIVLDEGDQLLIPEHIKTISRIVKSTLKDRQLLLFSATLPAELENDAKEWMNDPIVIRVGKKDFLKSDVKHQYFVCEERDKITILEKLAKSGVRALVFTRDIGNMVVLAEKLLYKKVAVAMLHSDARKDEREKALNGFRTGQIALLLATDIAARGLDIAGLEYVIHYDIPHDSTQYTHRSGRTGRQGANGTVLSLINQKEERDLKRLATKGDFQLERVSLFGGRIVPEQINGKRLHKKPVFRKK